MAVQKSKVTIVGGGIPGLCLALILADRNILVTVVEKQSFAKLKTLKANARTTALMQGSLEVLTRAGVWPDFQDQCTRLSQLSIIDDSSFPDGEDAMIRQDFMSGELGLSEFGYNVPLIPLTQFLIGKVKNAKNIKVLDKTDVTPDHKAITEAALIVGADGRHSTVRQWAGIDVIQKNYGQTAMTCLVTHDLSHNNTSTEFHRSGGPCTFVPYGDHKSAVVWVEKAHDAKRFMNMDKDAFTKELQTRSRGILGNLKLEIAPESWPLMTLKAKRFIAPKIALMAEAAHVMSPIGAQGLNLSLRDVNDLADVIFDAIDSGQPIGSLHILQNYETKRKKDVQPRYIGVDILNRSVANTNPIVSRARRVGLELMRYAGPLRTFIMRQGLNP